MVSFMPYNPIFNPLVRKLIFKKQDNVTTVNPNVKFSALIICKITAIMMFKPFIFF